MDIVGIFSEALWDQLQRIWPTAKKMIKSLLKLKDGQPAETTVKR